MAENQPDTTPDETPDVPPLSNEVSVWYRSADFDVRLDAGNLAVTVLDEREMVLTQALLRLADRRLSERIAELRMEQASARVAQSTGRAS